MTMALDLPDLCVPRSGSTTLRSVLSATLRRALGDLKAVLRQHARGPWGADVAEFSRVVAPLARTRPGALASAVRRTEIGVWLRCLRSGAPVTVEPERGVPALLTTLALELARQGVLPAALRLRHWPSRVPSSAGRLLVSIPDDAIALTFEAGRMMIERSGGERLVPSLVPSDAAYVPLDGSEARLALCDDNPLSGLEAHPDKAGNALDLGGQPVERWRGALGQALSIIEAHLPALRSEIELILQQVVPVGWDEHRHLSASIEQALGTIYLSLHPNEMTMTEAVIHEVSHQKLAALFEVDPVLHNAFSDVHVSPVRPDPRPLHGVLLAVHAFLPVAALYAAMLEAGTPGSEHPEFRRRFGQIMKGNRQGADVLRARAEPTDLGRQLLEEMDALDRSFDVPMSDFEHF